MNQGRSAFIICAFLVSPACNTLSAEEDLPALITNPTPQSRAELQRVVTGALHGAPVTLADDALTRDSLLIIERKQQRDLQDRPLAGREFGRPMQFRLVITGSHCVLVQEPDGKRWELAETTCKAQ